MCLDSYVNRWEWDERALVVKSSGNVCRKFVHMKLLFTVSEKWILCFFFSWINNVSPTWFQLDSRLFTTGSCLAIFRVIRKQIDIVANFIVVERCSRTASIICPVSNYANRRQMAWSLFHIFHILQHNNSVCVSFREKEVAIRVRFVFVKKCVGASRTETCFCERIDWFVRTQIVRFFSHKSKQERRKIHKYEGE